jgi:signal transduction histidine kinase
MSLRNDIGLGIPNGTQLSDELCIVIIDGDSNDRSLIGAVISRAWPKAKVFEIADALAFAEMFATHTFSIAIIGQPLDWADPSDVVKAIGQRHPACTTVTFVGIGTPTENPTALAAHLNPSDIRLPKTSHGFVQLPEAIRRHRLTVSRAATQSGTQMYAWGDTLWQKLPANVFHLTHAGILTHITPHFGATFSTNIDTAVDTNIDASIPVTLVGRALSELLVDTAAREAIEGALSSLTRLESLPAVFLTPNGVIHGQVTVWPHRDPTDDAIGFQGFVETTPSPNERVSETSNARSHPEPTDSGEHGRTSQAPTTFTPSHSPVNIRGQATDSLSAAMVCEIQEPLALLRQHADILAAQFGPALDDDARQLVSGMQRTSGQLAAMSRQMHAYRTDHPANQTAHSPVMLDSALSHALVTFESSITALGAEVTTDPLPTVYGDHAMLVTLFEHLLDNALKFRASEPPRVHFSAQERADDWLILVQDNGIGIPEADAERVLGLFERLHDPDAYDGAGIGLSLCRYIAAQHGGDVWTAPVKPVGTSVHITVSKHRAAAPAQGALDKDDPRKRSDA